MSKIFRPKAWYLVAIGAVALALDGARRLMRKRQEDAERADIELVTRNATSSTAGAPATPAPKPKAAAPAPTAAKAASSEKTPPSTKSKDDLTEIKGIGPVYAKRLTEAGITTFAALAKTSPERLREVTDATAAADPDEWIAQARLK